MSVEGAAFVRVGSVDGGGAGVGGPPPHPFHDIEGEGGRAPSTGSAPARWPVRQGAASGTAPGADARRSAMTTQDAAIARVVCLLPQGP